MKKFVWLMLFTGVFISANVHAQILEPASSYPYRLLEEPWWKRTIDDMSYEVYRLQNKACVDALRRDERLLIDLSIIPRNSVDCAEHVHKINKNRHYINTQCRDFTIDINDGPLAVGGPVLIPMPQLPMLDVNALCDPIIM